LLAVSFAQSDPAEKTVRSVFETKCAACHGAAQMSGLDLRNRDTILKGGKRGPAIVPGKAGESLLYKAVRRDGELQMPPGKTALSAADVNAIRDWINGGAKWASTPKTAQVSSWWSFKKPVRPAVPAVKDASRVRNPIDAFILAKLEQQGLHLAPEANRGTFVRRAYFDLHGLPPTPEQVTEFVNDKSPDAYEKLIDRILASPRYGERWGRSWLDLVRYADTSGFETDHFFITAWRYRDWAALLQQLGEAYLRAPEHFPTANVLAHEEVVPTLTFLCAAISRIRARRWIPVSCRRSTPGRPSSSRKTFSSFPSAARPSPSG
jgi:hypothetical protein